MLKTDLDLSIHAKKGPQKSRDTLPLRYGKVNYRKYKKDCQMPEILRILKLFSYLLNSTLNSL
jgi:hypothetical protein